MRDRSIDYLLRLELITVILLAPTAALACSVCFGGASGDPANTALRSAVLFLLVVIFFVLGIFAKFFWGIRNRTKYLLSKRQKD